MQAKPDAAAYEFYPEEERRAANNCPASLSYWQDAWRRLKRDKLAMADLTFVILMGLLAIFVPCCPLYL